MGASKRVAEMIVRDARAPTAARSWCAVRQRARQPRQRRAALQAADRARRAGDDHAPGDDALLHDDSRGGLPLLQAGGLGPGGELFVLNMGNPVRIVDLAHDLIRLSGLAGRDSVVYTGLRPGEKLDELLWERDAMFHATAHPDIPARGGNRTAESMSRR